MPNACFVSHSAGLVATGKPWPFSDRVQQQGGKLFGVMLMLSLADSKPKFRHCGRCGHLTQWSLSAFLTRPKVERVLTPRRTQGRAIGDKSHRKVRHLHLSCLKKIMRKANPSETPPQVWGSNREIQDVRKCWSLGWRGGHIPEDLGPA